jgi:hypothetical protein
MADPLEQVLRLVAEGHLTAAQAAPIIDALGSADDALDAADDALHAADDELGRVLGDAPVPGTSGRDGGSRPAGGAATSIRIEITEHGRKVINLRVPVSLGRMALDRIPGLSGTNADLVRQALADGRSGTLLVIDDEGDGVRIALE